MSAPDDPCAATIAELAPALRAGTLSPVALLEAVEARITARDGALAAVVHVSDTARAQAERAHREIRAGDWRGPLHGVPVAVKDNHTTLDMPTGAGTAAPGVAYPREDAGAVARLRAAGAIPFAKTRMHEFAWGMETPPTRNPRDPARVPGGSSGGSGAAVAAGMAPAALGSDTGGSIRIPASLCGCVGFKPTFGLIGRSGIVPHSWSLDHAGPLAASVADAGLVAHAMAGPDPRDPASLGRAPGDWEAEMAAGAEGLRVGICRRHFFEGLTEDAAARVEAALEGLAGAGARLVEIDLEDVGRGLGAIFAIELASSTNYHERGLREGAVAHFTEDVRLLVEMGRMVSGADYLQAERFRRRLGLGVGRAFADLDVIAAPTMPLTAWPAGARSVRIGEREESVIAASWRLTYPWNLLGLPALSLPCGTDAAGLPVGLQIAGPALGEGAVLRAALAAERRLGGPMPRTAPPG